MPHVGNSRTSGVCGSSIDIRGMHTHWSEGMKVGNDERMLRLHSVERMTGLSKSTLYRLIKQGSFPAPLRMTRKAVRWRREEVNEWLSLRPRAGGHGAS